MPSDAKTCRCGDVIDANVTVPAEAADALNKMVQDGAVVVGLSRVQVAVIVSILRLAVLDKTCPEPIVHVASGIIKGLSTINNEDAQPSPRGHYDA